MKTKNVIELNSKIEIFDELVGAEFVKALYKNIKLMEVEVKATDAVKEPTKKYIEVQTELQLLFRKYADVDKDGNLKVTKVEGQEDTLAITNKDKFQEYKKAEAVILKDNAEVVKLQDEKYKEYNRIIEEECNIEFIQIEEDLIPINITLKQRRLLDFMIKE